MTDSPVPRASSVRGFLTSVFSKKRMISEEETQECSPISTDVIRVNVDISMIARDPEWSALLTDVPLLLVDNKSLVQHPVGTVLVIKQVFVPDNITVEIDASPSVKQSVGQVTESPAPRTECTLPLED